MSLPRFVTLLVFATSALFLNSCGFSGRADAVNPTISELDSLDVQWGLPARKSRGGPRRTYQFVDSGTNTQAPAAATAPARETVSGQPPAMISPEPPATAPSSVPANLR